MSMPNQPDAPRNVDFDCTDLVEMPIELLREIVQRDFLPKTDGGDLLAQIFRILSGVLMSWSPNPEYSKRAVEFLEFADALDGLGPEKRAKGL